MELLKASCITGSPWITWKHPTSSNIQPYKGAYNQTAIPLAFRLPRTALLEHGSPLGPGKRPDPHTVQTWNQYLLTTNTTIQTAWWPLLFRIGMQLKCSIWLEEKDITWSGASLMVRMLLWPTNFSCELEDSSRRWGTPKTVAIGGFHNSFIYFIDIHLGFLGNGFSIRVHLDEIHIGITNFLVDVVPAMPPTFPRRWGCQFTVPKLRNSTCLQAWPHFSSFDAHRCLVSDPSKLSREVWQRLDRYRNVSMSIMSPEKVGLLIAIAVESNCSIPKHETLRKDPRIEM